MPGHAGDRIKGQAANGTGVQRNDIRDVLAGVYGVETDDFAG